MYIEDEDLGNIQLLPNMRAKRIIVRYRNGAFELTHPSYTKRDEIEKTVEQMKPSLLKMKEKATPKFIFSEDTEFSTLSFTLSIKQNSLSNVYTSLKDEILIISYPSNISLNSDNIQIYIKMIIENACRAEANRLLPTKVRELAEKHRFKVGDIKINKSRSRWGSCSSKKNINLSYFCMMLPPHLVDFIILHELCHTKEMNHGPRFWALLDEVSDGMAKELTEQLRQVKLKW